MHVPSATHGTAANEMRTNYHAPYLGLYLGLYLAS